MTLFFFQRFLVLPLPTRGLPTRATGLGTWLRRTAHLCIATLTLVSLTGGCKQAPDGKGGASGGASVAAEPERFSFLVPSEYVPLQLRGEGSETLRAPPGASVTPTENGFSIDRGPEFALDVSLQPPPLAQYKMSIEPARRAFEAEDAVIFKSSSGYAFLAVRELVPEWDESDRRRLACSSRGAGSSGAPTRADTSGFTRTAIQNMLAACRSLDLPSLE